MPSDYVAITRHNEKQLGLDTASRKTQISMYSDSTHFVYEILQNADDFGATEVTFKLSRNALQIEHNGEPFVEENVAAITYFGKSTSREDLVRTGRFGVGFKSVFAFTATPVVISGDEHFQIYGLYRVREHPCPVDLLPSQTRIILPFNHDSEQPDYVEEPASREEAYSKISARLAGLNMHTLLFTRNIRGIRWEIDDGRSGQYRRVDQVDDSSRLSRIHNDKESRSYLVFSRVPRWRNKEHKPVEIAFAVDGKNQISPIDDFLYVLFPTMQETHLQFILNGPYRTNPSRETISEEDSFNTHLVQETCTLMKDSLLLLKASDLLTTQFLSVLPNTNDKLRDFYAPLHVAICEAFHEQELVPTDNNSYACATDVIQGPAPIRQLITKVDLPFFTNVENGNWSKGVQQGSRTEQFLCDLKIQKWGWEQLQQVLNDKYMYYHSIEPDDKAWLQARTDVWVQKLYNLLADAIRREDCDEWALASCCIIRVIEDGEETHVFGSLARFPKRGYKNLPLVKREILRGRNQQATQKIHDSLVALGVSDIGTEDQIELLLETFYAADSAGVTDSQHLQHMQTFIKWWKQEKNSGKFSGYSIFSSSESDELHEAENCYLDSPLLKTELHVIYTKSVPDSWRKLKLWSGYRKLVGDAFCEFAVACGVADRLPITRHRCSGHPLWRELTAGLGGSRTTDTGTNRDFSISRLQDLLKLKKREINLLIWNTISESDSEVLEAAFCPNQQYALRTRKSSLVLELTDATWIPDKRGHLQKPCDITKEQLHRDFKYDNRNGWLEEIGFGRNAKEANEEYRRRKDLAAEIGIPVELADLVDELPKEEQKKEWKEMIATLKRKQAARMRADRTQKESVPYHQALAGVFSDSGRPSSEDRTGGGGSSQNPSRRRDSVAEDIATSIENEGKPGKRFSFALRKKWRGKNDQVRVALSEWYGGRCQICKETFTQRSGEPYFEGLYLVPHTTAEWLDRVGNVLCLCPRHSAMFQFGPKLADEDIIHQVMHLKVQAEGSDDQPAISMTLCGQPIEIKFADNHLIDLQEMIRIAQKSVPKSDVGKPIGQQIQRRA